MPPCHRLGHLQMGEPRHDPIGARLGLGQKGADQRLKRTRHCVKLITHPEFEIRRHLIIARAARVQPPGGFADQILQAGLDIHVDILKRGRELECSALDF